MRPATADYIPYYDSYINLIPEEDVISALYNNHTRILEFMRSIPADKEQFKYADHKWTVKQVLNHIIDTERIFCYRALCFARGEKQTLPGFDENDYAVNAHLAYTDLDLLAEEFDIVRKSTSIFFKQLSEKELLRKGKFSAGEANVLSIGYMICGHALHHINVIKEKYL